MSLLTLALILGSVLNLVQLMFNVFYLARNKNTDMEIVYIMSCFINVGTLSLLLGILVIVLSGQIKNLV